MALNNERVMKINYEKLIRYGTTILSSSFFIICSTAYVIDIPKELWCNLSIADVPCEAQVLIFKYVTIAKTLAKATEDLRALGKTHSKFNFYLNDPDMTEYILEMLSRLFTQGDMIEAALALGTQGATRYLDEHVLSKKNIQALWVDAMRQNNFAMMRYLASKNKNIINYVDSQGNTALHYASMHPQPEIVRWLLRNKADVNKKNNGGNTPLMLAIQSAVQFGEDAVTVVRILLNNGAQDPAALSSTSNPEIRKVLLEYGFS